LKKSNEQEKKEKARWQRILRTYGITPEQYKELDNGFCPICERAWSDTVRPCVDHDHKSGEVRGLLCLYCNRYRVGRFVEPQLVYRIYQYLDSPRRGWIVPPKKKKRKRKK
jgi:hypothetical protein